MKRLTILLIALAAALAAVPASADDTPPQPGPSRRGPLEQAGRGRMWR